MFKKFNRFSFLLLIFLILAFSVKYSFVYFQNFVSSNFFVALITLIVGSIAICLYLVQKIENKRDSARTVIQEIRRAEEIIEDYRENGSYQFTKKIIATNSWSKNIHHFVGDLDNDELDKISELYSTGEYLDHIIQRISDITLDYSVEKLKEDILGQSIIIRNISSAWQPRLEVVSRNLNLIYHSTIISKLKKIAKVD